MILFFRRLNSPFAANENSGCIPKYTRSHLYSTYLLERHYLTVLLLVGFSHLVSSILPVDRN